MRVPTGHSGRGEGVIQIDLCFPYVIFLHEIDVECSDQDSGEIYLDSLDKSSFSYTKNYFW